MIYKNNYFSFVSIFLILVLFQFPRLTYYFFKYLMILAPQNIFVQHRRVNLVNTWLVKNKNKKTNKQNCLGRWKEFTVELIALFVELTMIRFLWINFTKLTKKLVKFDFDLYKKKGRSSFYQRRLYVVGLTFKYILCTFQLYTKILMDCRESRKLPHRSPSNSTQSKAKRIKYSKVNTIT